MRAELSVLDLFSGIGGFSLGLHWAGFHTIAFCEIDPFCRSILARHWPGIPIHDDIRLFRPEGLRPGLVCGGFPCQDVSVAGRGAGLDAGRGGGRDGARSGLWAEMRRVVGTCRPGWVVVENVPGLRGRGADRVIADLAALGYHSWPLVVGAVHAGAPHRRRRVFVVARLAAYAAGARLEVRQPSAAPAPVVQAQRACRWPAEPGFVEWMMGFPAGWTA